MARACCKSLRVSLLSDSGDGVFASERAIRMHGPRPLEFTLLNCSNMFDCPVPACPLPEIQFSVEQTGVRVGAKLATIVVHRIHR